MSLWRAILVCSLAAPAAALGRLDGPDFNLVFDYGYDQTPDCVQRQPLVRVNGYWPPPTLHVRADEEITVRSKNELVAVAFTIHFHGFLQMGTPWDDGTGMINQCPIIPDTNHTIQRFLAPAVPGTYIYHGHVAHAKVAGFTGLLVVEPNLDRGIGWPAGWEHDEELDILLADSFHQPSLPALAGLLQPGSEFKWVGDPQSVLVNGIGRVNCDENPIYNCDQANRNGEQLDFCNFASDNPQPGPQTCGAGTRVYYNALRTCKEDWCPNTTTFTVETGKTYLLRVANGGVGSLLNLKIENHPVTVVALDGYAVEPTTVETLELAVGQRADVLLTADAAAGAYWMSAMTRARPAVRYGSAILYYDGATTPPPDTELNALQQSQPAWADSDFTIAWQNNFTLRKNGTGPEHSKDEGILERTPKRTFVFMSTQERFYDSERSDVARRDHTPPGGGGPLAIGDLDQSPQCFCDDSDGGMLRWAAGRRTFENPTTPLLHKIYYGQLGLTTEELETRGVYELEEGEFYDIVLQNYPACDGSCEMHPWHFHGHRFVHVGTWPGAYNGTLPTTGGGGHYFRDTWILSHAPKQNTTPAAGDRCSATLEPCGYSVIRFVADNPGAWFFHCHIDWHLVMGMAVAFYYRDVPAPDLSRHTICGAVTPQMVVDKYNQGASDGAASRAPALASLVFAAAWLFI